MSSSVSRVALRPGQRAFAVSGTSLRSPTSLRHQYRSVRHASSLLSRSNTPRPTGPPRRSRLGRLAGLAVLGGAVAGAVWAYPMFFGDNAVAGIPQVEESPQADLEFEKERRPPSSKEHHRDLISSQHLQVKKSWENPGVYAWGSNAGRVVAPDLPGEGFVKTPRRIPWFDGQLLRDLKMDQQFGAAVTENGDLVQWGAAFSAEDPLPAVTLGGKDLVKVAISRDRVLALSSGGSVYSLPVSQKDQQETAMPEEGSSSWFSFWSNPSSPVMVSYRTIKPKDLGRFEKVVDVCSGQEHCLLLTSSGRVFSAASSSESFPSRGQFGIPGLTWLTRPQGPYDQPHEVGLLKGFKVKKIAAGDYHSLVLDDRGRAFGFGDNSAGQSGFPVHINAPFVDKPSLLPFDKLYDASGLVPRVTSIAAGGANSYFTVDATKVAAQRYPPEEATPARDVGKVVADTWACGEGLYGSLGTGKWTHVSNGLSKITALSGMFEWDERKSKLVPIRLASVSVGGTHAAAVMGNVTRVDASGARSDNDTNWGADVLWWGGNEHYQLGTGRRSNASTPVYIGPLDGGAGDAQHGRKGGESRFQITPRKTVRLGEDGKGRKVSVEQRIVCGRFVTAVYSGA